MKAVLDATRSRFVATFADECDAIALLIEMVAASGPPESIATLTSAVHRLSGLAGTIGFPHVSARASELESLLGHAGSGAFDLPQARRAVEAIRTAFDKDLASPPVRSTPPTDGAPLLSAIRVLIVDDHAILRRGLRALLSDDFRGATFGEASDARQAIEQLRKATWDLALLDITMPGKSGLDLLKELKAEWPRLPVLVLSGHAEDQFAVRALKAGAGGYMTKDSVQEELTRAVRKILSGGRYVSPELAEKLASSVTKDLSRTPHETLSDREYEVMFRIGSGKTVTEIASELSLSAKTISTYRARVLEKLGVKNSSAIVQYAIRNGLA